MLRQGSRADFLLEEADEGSDVVSCLLQHDLLYGAVQHPQPVQPLSCAAQRSLHLLDPQTDSRSLTAIHECASRDRNPDLCAYPVMASSPSMWMLDGAVACRSRAIMELDEGNLLKTEVTVQ